MEWNSSVGALSVFIQLNHTQSKHIFVWNNEASGDLV